MTATFLSGLGGSVPERVVGNAALAAELGVEEEWILSACGIRERRRLGPGESLADLAERAARAGLADAGCAPADLGAIVVATGSSPRAFPGLSAELQRRLEAPGIPAFDVPLPSVGSLFALEIASALAPRRGPVLVVAADSFGSLVERPPVSKETAILFGDGASAVVVTKEPGPLELAAIRVASDGAFAEDLSLGPAGGPDPGAALSMNGRAVILQASRKMPAVIREILAGAALEPADVDVLVLHQANVNLLAAVARSLGIPAERLVVQVDRLGNTSAASIFLALLAARDEGRLLPGRRVALAGFGAGFAWGAALLVVR